MPDSPHTQYKGRWQWVNEAWCRLQRPFPECRSLRSISEREEYFYSLKKNWDHLYTYKYIICVRINVKHLVGDKTNSAFLLDYTLEHWFSSCKIGQCKKYIKFLSNVSSSWCELPATPCQPSVLTAWCAEAVDCGVTQLCGTRERRYGITLWLWHEKLINSLESFEKTGFPHPQRQTFEACSLVSVEGLSTMCFCLVYLHRNFKKKPACAWQKYHNS